MTIETEVAALTTATTSLLSAVNVKKAVLDASVANATTQAATAVANAATATATTTAVQLVLFRFARSSSSFANVISLLLQSPRIKSPT